MLVYVFFGLLFILFCAFKYLRQVQYYGKFTFYILACSVASAILPYVGLFRYPIRDHRNGMLLTWSFRVIVNLLGLECEVRGVENIDNKNRPAKAWSSHKGSYPLMLTHGLSEWRDDGITQNNTTICPISTGYAVREICTGFVWVHLIIHCLSLDIFHTLIVNVHCNKITAERLRLFINMFVYVFFGILFILFCAFKYLHQVQYYGKFTFYILACSVASAILPYVGLFRYPIRDHRNGMLPAWSFRVIVNLLGLEYEVRGVENIDKNEGGVIVAAPHQSILDLAVNAYLWPLIGRGCSVAKKFLLYVFPFGIGVWVCGTLFIDRTVKQNAVKQLQMQTDAIQNRRSKIVIYPEGTRAQNNKIMPFKKGAFHLAIDSQSMIQPVVISNYHFLNHEEKRFQNGKIIISILPAVSCKGMTKDDVNTLLEQTKRLMDTQFDKISNETRL